MKFYVSASVAVIIKVILQDARCNNKDKICILIFSANVVCNTTPSKTNSSRHYRKFTSVFM